MKIFTISGLGADRRVFEYLTLKLPMVSVEWLKPNKNEKIQAYAQRIIEEYDIRNTDCILGVSFGGIMAVEISKIVNPKYTILISSVELGGELRKMYRLLGKTKVLRYVPPKMLKLPKLIAKWTFGAENTKLLYNIIDDTDLEFAKWAINELITWDNNERISNCLKINGSNDKLIPIVENEKTICIQNGTHFMVVDRADEISLIVNNWLKAKD